MVFGHFSAMTSVVLSVYTAFSGLEKHWS